MFYDGYHFGGMHLFWWFAWLLFIFWIFATPYSMMGYRMLKTESPIDVLKRRLATGEINNEEYHEKKKIIEAPLNK